MDDSAKTSRLGLVAAALAALAAPVVIADEANAAPHGGVATPQTGSRNAIVLGSDGKSHNQTIVLGNDGKPQNNRYVIGRDGQYHDGAAAHPNAIGYGTQPHP